MCMLISLILIKLLYVAQTDTRYETCQDKHVGMKIFANSWAYVFNLEKNDFTSEHEEQHVAETSYFIWLDCGVTCFINVYINGVKLFFKHLLVFLMTTNTVSTLVLFLRFWLYNCLFKIILPLSSHATVMVLQMAVSVFYFGLDETS